MGHAEVVFEAHECEVNAKVPVAVLVDRDREAIVVACRGTLSIEDCISDATCGNEKLSRQESLGVLDVRERDLESAPLKGLDLDDGGQLHFAHAGMTAIARNTVAAVEPALRTLDEDPLAKAYPIVFVGHSLGAGVAALSALFLRATFGDRVRCGATPREDASMGLESLSGSAITYVSRETRPPFERP